MLRFDAFDFQLKFNLNYTNFFLKKINFSYWFIQSKHSGQKKKRFFILKFSYICVK